MCIKARTADKAVGEDNILSFPRGRNMQLAVYQRYAYNHAIDTSYNGDKEQFGYREDQLNAAYPSQLEPHGNLRVVEYATDDFSSGFNAIVQKLAASLSEASPLFGPLPLPLPPVNPSIDPLNYGFGTEALPEGLPKVTVTGRSIPWDPKTHSFGGWVPLNGPGRQAPMARIVTRKYVNGQLYKVFCLIAAAVANPPALYETYATVGSIPNPNYSFNYAVNDPHTGDNKAQWETRDGDVVRGAYSLVEPDGNIRIVEYVADSIHGFNAVVKRTRPNVHPVSLPAAAPLIAAPVFEPVAHIAPIATPIYEPLEAPIVPIEPAPIYEPFNPWSYLPIGNPAPWVSLTGTSYGKKGNIVRRWTAGPISLDGQKVTIQTKH
ncbi:jg10301 [Pararge aegeria aegeria]|uniref:Jg10301 protein n=1 Tax=Pararge aegeria aegeria TaxID=348720 RepID=A0A8S4SFD3_9NEOP|nr:jg10301 [Pararge aegeria aegeria]